MVRNIVVAGAIIMVLVVALILALGPGIGLQVAQPPMDCEKVVITDQTCIDVTNCEEIVSEFIPLDDIGGQLFCERSQCLFKPDVCEVEDINV